MAGLTRRFKFNKFGGGVQGTIGDNAQKYTSADRDLLDTLLAQVELHDHHVHSVASAGPAAPDAALVPDGGGLAAGETYYYRFATVDAGGVESLASDEVSVETPTPLDAPGAPAAYVDETNSAGDLAPGMYYYALTGLRGVEESVLGEVAAIRLSGTEGAVTLTLPDFDGAEGFQVWRMAGTDTAYTRIAIVDAPTGSLLDTGATPADPCAGDPGNTPPTLLNSGISSFGVDVALPDGLSLAGVTSWRLYRSSTSGVYASSSLVHEVVETADEWDEASALVRTWRDDGDATTLGAPLDTDTNMRIAPFVFDSAEDLPAPAGYPEGYPLLVAGRLYALIEGAWKVVAGGGGGGLVVLTAPAGGRFVLSVDDAGALVTAPTVLPGPPTPPTTVTVS